MSSVFRFDYIDNNNSDSAEFNESVKQSKKDVKIVEVVKEVKDKKNKKEKYRYPREEKKIYNKKDDLDYGPFGTDTIHDIQKDDKITSDVTNTQKIVEKLLSIEYPEQRSKAWFDMRKNCISASDGGVVMEENKNECPFFFIMKKLIDFPFKGGKACYHGTKYEEIATMIYSYRMNVHVEEFGLVLHPKYSFLGASPDGIVGKYKLDGKHLTQYVGRMLEIKCPATRVIKKEGKEKGDIVPPYYWVQVQQQLECCDLEYCDFWQCTIKEYENRDDFIEDTDHKEPFRSKWSKFEKGCVIQLLPFKNAVSKSDPKYDQTVYDCAKFIYPPKIEMSPYECDVWIAETLTDMQTDPKYKDYYFDCVKYWKLTDSFNYTVKRDKKWFKNSLEKYRQTWEMILHFRNNPDKLKILSDYYYSFNMDEDNIRKDKKVNTEMMDVMNTLINCDLKKDNKKIVNIMKKIEEYKKSKYVDESDESDDD